jgi:hypothetical protein
MAEFTSNIVLEVIEEEQPEKKEEKVEECIELKNIKYKTMLLNGVSATTTQSKASSSSLSNLELFLENEQKNNKNEPWCKLDKTTKIKKLNSFIEVYKKESCLDEEETNLLAIFLRDCLDRKRFQRVKDVTYDKETGTVKSIPALAYSKQTKHFTLKNVDKRVSTTKSLAPKKTQNGTVRNKKDNELEVFF